MGDRQVSRRDGATQPASAHPQATLREQRAAWSAHDAVFESVIRGASMAPAIPGGARLRVAPLDVTLAKRGDVVFFLVDQRFMVHRVAHVPRHGAAADYLLTIGDACLVPDLPVRKDRLVGIVAAVETAAGWIPPGPVMLPSILHRLVRACTITATMAALAADTGAAQRVVGLLTTLERIARPVAARLLAGVKRS